MRSLRWRYGKWRIRYYRDGRRFEESAGTARKNEPSLKSVSCTGPVNCLGLGVLGLR